MRRARQFTKRVEIWQTTEVDNGFGGNLVTDAIIASSWAKVETMSGGRFANRTTDLGITETNQGVLFTFRKRNDLIYNSINQYLMYRGVKYIISSFPDNVDFNDAFVEIIAVREAQKQVSVFTPVGGTVYPYTYDYILS